MKFTCNLIEADKPNLNGRIYPLKTMERVIDQFENRQNDWLGINFICTEPNLNMMNVSHKIEDLYIKDGKFVAGVKILDTPGGKQIKGMTEKDLELFPRFIARMDDNKVVDIESVISFDLVPRNLTGL